MRKTALSLLLCMALLVGCSEHTAPSDTAVTTTSPTQSKEDVKEDLFTFLRKSNDASLSWITRPFLDFLEQEFGESTVSALYETMKQGTFTAETWHELTGNTAVVLQDMYSGALDPEHPNYRSDITVLRSKDDETTIRVVGDISFADNWHIAPKIGQNGVLDVMSEETLELLKSADILLVNNEFTYSTRGKPLNKAYTFRAHPDNVQYMLDIGADVVSLANNHAYDYGADAFEDTLNTLAGVQLPYIGAGRNKEEAAKPHYFIVNGRKYAFSAATRAEKTIRTPEAGENSSGVMRTYDATQYLETIKSAEQECDYNIVYVHWGAEGSHQIEDGLYEMGCQYIDAGADIVIGAHAHVLQGIQFYNNVPIVYNLGNFLFNAYNIDTGVLEITISDVGIPSYRFVPAKQRYSSVKLVHDTEKQRILTLMDELSIGVQFDDDGYFKEAM